VATWCASSTLACVRLSFAAALLLIETFHEPSNTDCTDGFLTLAAKELINKMRLRNECYLDLLRTERRYIDSIGRLIDVCVGSLSLSLSHMNATTHNSFIP